MHPARHTISGYSQTVRYICVAVLLLPAGCGQATKVQRYDLTQATGPTFAMLQEGKNENALRLALLARGINVRALHVEQRGFSHESAIREPGQPDYFLKMSARLNRPCVAPGSELIYGTVEIINGVTAQSIMSIEELGFDDFCLGSKAFYGDVYEKLAKSLQKIIPELKSTKSKRGG